MEKEVILVMDFRYDEGARPRRQLICPCITTKSGGGISGTPIVVERWKRSEYDKQQNKDT